MSEVIKNPPGYELAQQAALYYVRQWGDPVLRTKASPVEIFDQPLKNIALQMKTIMEQARGVGLAAPQIGMLLQMFVCRLEENGLVEVIINPTIIHTSDEVATREEGCLSLIGIHVDVERPIATTVRYQDLQGTEHTRDFEGIAARIILHESDHLNGVTILDRTSKEHRKAGLRALRTGICWNKNLNS
jgi:peptide deformylase